MESDGVQEHLSNWQTAMCFLLPKFIFHDVIPNGYLACGKHHKYHLSSASCCRFHCMSSWPRGCPNSARRGTVDEPYQLLSGFKQPAVSTYGISSLRINLWGTLSALTSGRGQFFLGGRECNCTTLSSRIQGAIAIKNKEVLYGCMSLIGFRNRSSMKSRAGKCDYS